MLTPSISIIVPVYNSEKHITQCVDSILGQTFSNFELILVDDGSSDKSGSICDYYVSKDERVKVIHQHNSGVSAARNAGLEASKSRYVTFVDSDDYVLDCFLSSLYSAITKRANIDMAYCGYIIQKNGNCDIISYKSKSYLDILGMKEALCGSKLLIRCSPWGKLYNAEIIRHNNIHFDPSLSLSEDRLFIYNFLRYSRGVATTSVIGYIYNSYSPTSLKHKTVPTEMLVFRQEAIQKAAKELIDYFNLITNDCYYIARHLLMIYVELQKSASKSMGYDSQIELHKRFYNNSIFENVVQDKRMIDYISADKYRALIVSGDLKRFNKVVKNDERLLLYKQKIKSFIIGNNKMVKNEINNLTIYN